MLLLIDLDNTLIDRRAAFKTWALSRFGAAEAPWLIEADRDGYERRELLAGMIAERYGIDAAEILTELRAGMVEYVVLDPRVAAALGDATAAGFVPVVVSNGAVARQEAKLRRTGLDRLVAACESAGWRRGPMVRT